MLSFFIALISAGPLCSVAFLLVIGAIGIKDISPTGITILMVSFIVIFPSCGYLWKVSKEVNAPSSVSGDELHDKGGKDACNGKD